MDERVGKVVARDFGSMTRYICIGEGDSYREFEVDLSEALELWRTLNKYVDAKGGCSMRFEDATPGRQHSFGFTPREQVSEVAPASFDGMNLTIEGSALGDVEELSEKIVQLVDEGKEEHKPTEAFNKHRLIFNRLERLGKGVREYGRRVRAMERRMKDLENYIGSGE